MAKPLAFVAGVITVGEAAADVLRGDYKKAAEKIGSFAYDQTIGTAVDAVGVVKDAAEFLADPLAGTRKNIGQIMKEQEEAFDRLFGHEEQQTPPAPSPFPEPAPSTPIPKRDRGNMAEGLLLLTVAIGLIAEGSRSAPESEGSQSEKIDLGEIDCDEIKDLEELNDYLYSCAE